ncbi:MAG TPA: competence/damage-inducible protein A [Firmicutes bacterium]|uniref:CinA-like protein n=1 Tax=candidate division TA06 bacterium TaxID=2250710 RepID=A0A660S9T1_UNCT6|nr:MAG: competence/damage-inducible protein A [candidate division TA06 bacterium]HFD04606.1 competence/damage-inducible protein A [Bacillota bacterium]
MRVSILTIGNEILSGRIVNTNASFIASRLYETGLDIVHILTVADKADEIKKALDYLINDSDIIITTGGLGPTSDDVTKKVITEYFGKKLYLEEEIAKYLSDYLKKNIDDKNLRSQALIPTESYYFINKVGTAPGILVENGNIKLFMLPGVPMEMKYLFSEWIIPYLKKNFRVDANIVYNFRTSTIPEVEIFEKLSGKVDKNDMSYLGFYPSYGVVDIRISGKRSDREKLEELRDLVKTEFKDFIFEEGSRKLEEVLGELLKKEGLTLAVAESLTGGLIGKKLTDIPGSSLYFLGGAVTYSNYAKMKILGVREESIKRFGAVSKETCEDMLKGVREVFNSDCSIAVTGIAGPSGGTDKKPVGLVYIGGSMFDKFVIKRYTFPGNRDMIRERTCNYSLFLLLKLLESNK